MKKNIVFILLFLIFIFILTFPLLMNFKSYIPGFFSTDEPYNYIWNNWRIKYSFQNGLSLRDTHLITYPFGWKIDSFGGYISYLWEFWQRFLSIFTTPVLAYDIQVLVNFIFCGLISYILVLYLTNCRLCAFLSSITFSFCPYQFMRIWQHLGLTYNQWIPLVLLSAILLKENNQRRYFILFLLSMILLFSFDYSVAYFGIINLIIFLFYTLLFHWRIKLFKQKSLLRKDFIYIKKVVFIGIISLIILFPQFFSIIQKRSTSSLIVSSAWNPLYRPFEDLFEQSAKPLSYLLPAAVHPIFGRFTERFMSSHLYGISFTEHTLYLGWTPLILAFVGFRRWRSKRKQLSAVSSPLPVGRQELLGNREDFYIGFFVFMAIVAWLFSQPPWWKLGPIKIYMPSFFMYKILPMFRAYCRFGILVMLAVAVLAGFGLKFILDKFRSQKTKVVLTCLFSGLVLFEFWNWPPYKVIDVSGVPAVYYWLKAQPGDFVIAEYPLDINGPNEMFKFYQTEHEKKIINGTMPGRYANKVAKTITKLSQPHTTGVLKWMEVKYVLVHREDYLKTELIEEIEELNKIPLNPNLKLIKSFPAQECPRKDIMCVQKAGPIDVYEVIAQPVKPDIK